MLKVEVKKAQVTEKSGTARSTGKPYTIREQEAYAWTYGVDGKLREYPQRIVLPLGDKQEPYAVGVYTIAPSALFVGDFDRLMIGRVTLVAQAASAKAA